MGSHVRVNGIPPPDAGTECMPPLARARERDSSSRDTEALVLIGERRGRGGLGSDPANYVTGTISTSRRTRSAMPRGWTWSGLGSLPFDRPADCVPPIVCHFDPFVRTRPRVLSETDSAASRPMPISRSAGSAIPVASIIARLRRLVARVGSPRTPRRPREVLRNTRAHRR